MLTLTDRFGDPVLVNWLNVTLIEEVRKDEGTDERNFLRTRIWFTGGSPSSASVREQVPEILKMWRSL